MTEAPHIVLAPRTAEHVRIFWEKTRVDPTLKALIPLEDISLEEVLCRFEASLAPGASSFGRVILADGQYVGDIWCYAFDPQEKQAMLSILLFEREARGRGIGPRALDHFLTELCDHLPVERLGAFTYASNHPSIRLLERAGFRILERFEEDGVASIYAERSLQGKAGVPGETDFSG